MSLRLGLGSWGITLASCQCHSGPWAAAAVPRCRNSHLLVFVHHHSSSLFSAQALRASGSPDDPGPNLKAAAAAVTVSLTRDSDLTQSLASSVNSPSRETEVSESESEAARALALAGSDAPRCCVPHGLTVAVYC